MKSIPSGTVTFLFTDIEGSTGLWERFPEAMRSAFSRQEAILRSAVAEYGGYAYKMIGDAFQVAFDTASQALAAALAAQSRLQAEDWGEAPVRVRMALHTAVTEERGDDYVGPELNRLGRLLSVSNGGQVLLTQTTCDLVQDHLPQGASLHDLGAHRLKDLVRAEHIYQLVAPGLLVDFPHLKTLDAFPHNLPLERTSFIGRGAEIAGIKRLLLEERARLVTLTGPGGTGKTRLALQVAADVLESFRDGVWLAELAPLADPALILPTVAAAVGLRETPRKNLHAALIDWLMPRRLLLILDNSEHVIEASASLVDDLLGACPGLQILATSRELLGAEGETPFRVPSLPTPDLRHLPGLEDLAQVDSVRLFQERAAQTLPGFHLTEANGPVIAHICSRLDGIPLAIELAAARVRVLSVEQISARLDDAFRLLTGGSRTVLPRHQTLKALIDWSYYLLQPQERRLLIHLSVFAGGWSLEAAEAVCGDAGQVDVLTLLAQLVDKSLVVVGQEDTPETRYHMLETIRQYAREKTPETTDAQELRDRHLDYFMGLARQAEPHLRSSGQAAWLDRLELELDNLRLALEWSRFARPQDGLQLATRLLWFWHIRGHGQEGIQWLERLLADTSAVTSLEGVDRRLDRARALGVIGFLLEMQIQFEKGRAYLTEGLEIARSLGAAGRQVETACLLHLASVTPEMELKEVMYQQVLAMARQLRENFLTAEALQNLGWLWVTQGKYDAGWQALKENLELRKQIDDLDGLGMASLQHGNISFIQGRLAESEEAFAVALDCFRKVGNLRFVSEALFAQAMLAFSDGDFTRASQINEQAIAIGHEMRDKSIVAVGLFRLGRVSMAQGDLDQAVRRYQEVLKIAQETGFKPLEAIAPFGLAVVAVSQGDYHQAYGYLKQAISLWREMHDDFDIGLSLMIMAELASGLSQLQTSARLFGTAERLLPPWALKFLSPLEVENFTRSQQAVKAALGEQAYQAAWEIGQALSLEQAFDLAVSLSQQVEAATGSPPAGST